MDTNARPVLLTTEAEIQRAKQRAADTSSPFHASWLRVRSQANAYLNFSFTPQELDDTEQYYRDANPEARRVHALAVAYRVSGNVAYLNKARSGLTKWARYSNADLPAGDPAPSWRQFHYPGKAMPHAAGLVISRVLVIFADAYAMLYPYLPTSEHAEIERWFRSMRSPIQHSAALWESADWFNTAPGKMVKVEPPWLNRQYYNNHLTAQMMGLLTIGYVTGDNSLISYALNDSDNPRDLQEDFLGELVTPGQALQERDPSLGNDNDRWPDPLRGELYDRYRVTKRVDENDSRDKGLIYASAGQRFLSLAAELARNNNAPIDYWQYVPETGESLRDSYATYAPWMSATTPRAKADALACRGRYYENSAYTRKMEQTWRSLTELAFREYPYDPDIRAVVRSAPARDYNDGETFGPSAALLKGELLDPPGGPAWTYQSTDGGAPTTPFRTGGGADSHFLGDWDGDGVDTPGWRTGNTFYLSNLPSGKDPVAYPYGRTCDQPLIGDWDGDGTDSIGVRRGKSFLLSDDNKTTDVSYAAGRGSDRAIVGDWDGDGVDTPGLIRGKTVFLRTGNTNVDHYLPEFQFARVGDRFVAGDWDGDGIDTLAAVRQNGSRLTWYLRAGNAVNSPVMATLTHGAALDGATAGNTTGGAADELVAITYR
ncbi:alginate lyase family protein [Streptomyces sp. L2]|uniref:alginate lyase family protein n=1 Tax=Streptomyces sp. L2 TaxID=2162665 RepID=UPI0013E96113|nr:alginate lyase family protein [Streptomyces sp. L2]